MNERTEIEIELTETVVFSRRNERFETICTQCGCLAEMATPLVASIITRSTERTIFRFVEAGELHFAEHDRLFVCMRSLTEKLYGLSAPRSMRFLK